MCFRFPYFSLNVLQQLSYNQELYRKRLRRMRLNYMPALYVRKSKTSWR